MTVGMGGPEQTNGILAPTRWGRGEGGYLGNNIAAALALEHPGQQSVQAAKVGHGILLQQKGQGCHFVTGGAAAPHLLQPLGILPILAACRHSEKFCQSQHSLAAAGGEPAQCHWWCQ